MASVSVSASSSPERYGTPFAQKMFWVPDIRGDVRYMSWSKILLQVTHKLVPEEKKNCVRQLKLVTHI